MGRILTFYSYKGGVGRSFALANVATMLALWGYKVLCIDWDLEAPGLSYYFGRRRKPTFFRSLPHFRAEDRLPRHGLAQMIAQLSSTNKPNWKHYVQRLDMRFDTPKPTIGMRRSFSLDLITAGNEEKDYAEVVASLDWNALYAEHNLGDFIEKWKLDLRSEYDFIFIDSRTGISDTGGICTAHLPDILCLICTANLQSLQGGVEVARRAQGARDQLPYDLPKLRTLPIVSRFDGREEYALADKWRRTIVDHVKGVYGDWVSNPKLHKAIMELTTVPYITKWAFGEDLAVLEEFEEAYNPDYVSYSLETIASLIIQDLADTDLLVSNRDSYVARARSSHEVTHDFFVSYRRQEADVAHELTERLELAGASVLKNGSLSRLAATAPPEFAKSIENCSAIIVIIGSEFSDHQRRELSVFLRGSALEREGRGLVFPVAVAPDGSAVIPLTLLQYRIMDCSRRQVSSVTREIVDMWRRFKEGD